MSDLISRADAIKAIVNSKSKVAYHDASETVLYGSAFRQNEIIDILSALPSAKGGDTEMDEVKPQYMQVSPNNGADLISRAEAIDAVANAIWHYPNECYYNLNDFDMAEALAKDALMALPSAEAEQVTGKLNNPCDSLLTGESDTCKESGSKLESAEAVQGWIPFTRRPMTEEEQKDYPNCTFIFDCVLPDDGDEILVSNGRFVWMDTFCNDIDGCYLDGGDDIDEDMAWMPLPKPYKGGEDE